MWWVRERWNAAGFSTTSCSKADGPITQGKIVSVLYARFKLGSEVVPFTKEVLAKVTFIDLTLAIAWHLNSAEDGSEGLAVLRALSVML